MNLLQIFRRGTISFCKCQAPGQLVIQLTDQCNAHCPQCGMRVSEPFQRSRLDPQQVRGIIDTAAANGVQAVSFTGGEPMLRQQELIELIRHAGKAGIPFIRTGTNGFFLTGSHQPGFTLRIERLAEVLADTPLRNFWISLDSAVPKLHETMRGFPGVVAGIEKALPIFHRHGIYPSVNLGINRNITEETRIAARQTGESPPEEYAAFFLQLYENAFAAFYRFVINLGFTIVNCCYPMSIECSDESRQLNPVYAATSQGELISFSRLEKSQLFRALLNTIPKFRPDIRIFSPRISLYTLQHQYSGDSAMPYPCRGGKNFFFITAKDGMTYPCGFRGNENLGPYGASHATGKHGSASDCRLCDWECFRDPSELFGPLLHARYSPMAVLGKCFRDPIYPKLWLSDLLYSRACDFFDGRRPLDRRRLSRFAHLETT